jgi:1-acyl-sn-glycerol-3-phosphate acyltransferase
MAREAPQRAAMVYWVYGAPPSVYDMSQNCALSKAVRIGVHLLLRAYLRACHGFRPRGAGMLRGLRGHLIVANHASHLDALALVSAFGLRQVNGVRTLCAKDYFFAGPLKRAIAFLLANAIPMDRDRFDARAVACCRKDLRAGANVIIFPEGTRSPDGRMRPFKPGIGLLALRYGLPVLPAFIRGAYERWPKGRWLPRPGRVEVVFGRSRRYVGLSNRKRNWLWVAQDIQDCVARLAARISQEPTEHEYLTYQADEGPRPFAGPAQRRHPHRPRGRVHLRQDGGLRLPERTVGEAADRQDP